MGTTPILDRQLAVLRAITPHILIVGGDPLRGQGAGVPVVRDRVTGAGALGGLYTALAEAPTEQVLVIACDMPFLTAPFLSALAARGAGLDALVPRDARGPHPLCASYSRRIAPHLDACIAAGRLRVVEAVEGVGVHYFEADELARFDADGRLLFNVNTPEDYARARH